MTWWTRETKWNIDQLKAELISAQSGKLSLSRVSPGECSNEISTIRLHGEKRKCVGKRKEKERRGKGDKREKKGMENKVYKREKNI